MNFPVHYQTLNASLEGRDFAIFKVLFIYPSSIYNWSIGQILEHEFLCLGRLGSQGSKEKKVDLMNSEQLLRVVFSTVYGQKNQNFFKNILASALKSYIKWILYIFFLV